MSEKSNKELAIEATIEFAKSWNAATNTKAMQAQEFVTVLSTIYDGIQALDKR